MKGLEELKTSYEYMRKECSFIFSDAHFYDNERWELIFKYFGVGIKMSFSYEFIIGNDPALDDIKFFGDPCLHFSIYCYQIVTDFIQTLQKYRSDLDTIDAFIKYLTLYNEFSIE